MKAHPAKPPSGWTYLGDALSAGEAGFLAAELEARGIRCRIRALEDSSPPEKAVYSVMIDARRQEEAEHIRNALLKDDEPTFPDAGTSSDSRWARAGIAGVLGLLFGARLGARLKGSRWVLIAPLLLAMVCFAGAFFWPDVRRE